MKCIRKLRGGVAAIVSEQENNFGSFTKKKIRSYGIDNVVRQTTNKKSDVKKTKRL
jgi:hypothetical protein